MRKLGRHFQYPRLEGMSILAIALRIAIAAAAACGSTAFFWNARRVWQRPITEFELPMRTTAAFFQRSWFFVNILWLLCGFSFAVVVLVKPTWALWSLLGFPVLTGVGYLVIWVSSNLSRK